MKINRPLILYFSFYHPTVSKIDILVMNISIENMKIAIKNLRQKFEYY